ncbi:glycoprotein 3-alpha-L-fucosyltransferase A-like [Haliotis rufescens]|uniref:glycoprotein 3-alpha-L-fucosyltransferase A-like n=1 Tax=Haliotis rufescens TaxID=6454 RepID=UPI00201F60C7|nr:glycoprotein 3-alpha-L-fucosyltransferase A-like [Haliotis rufescens]XP_048247308.1 glycoprotein 3-alpha-L-fucosyltransferase A-like [Haliotis rufescens]
MNSNYQRCLFICLSMTTLAAVAFYWTVNPDVGVFQITTFNSTKVNTSIRETFILEVSQKHPLVLRRRNVVITSADSPHATKRIVWMNVPPWYKTVTSFAHCYVRSCEISTDEAHISSADAVVVNGVNLPSSKHPNTDMNQVWIMYGWEAPPHYSTNTIFRPDWNGRFNWTLTYRLDSDIPFPYNRIVYTGGSVNISDVVRRKSRSIAWFVSNCRTPSKREVYVRELRKHIDVDIYGACRNTKSYDCPKGRSFECLGLLNTTYRFYLSFENSLCKDYITEKFYNTFMTSAIPIVRGGADYERLLPEGTFINTASFDSPKSLANYIRYLERNETAMGAILEKKHKYEYIISEGTDFDWRCQLCAKLHGNTTRKSHTDMKQWLKDGKCIEQPKDLP